MIPTLRCTIESYNISAHLRHSLERFQKDHTVAAHPQMFALYRHGTKANIVHSRMVKTVEVESLPALSPDENFFCWMQIDGTIADYESKIQSGLDLLDRILSSAEKALLCTQITDCKDVPSELGELLLQRNQDLQEKRSRYTVVLDASALPSRRFSTTTNLWIRPDLIAIAKKVASILSCIDSSRMCSYTLEQHSSKDAPSLQITKAYESAAIYQKDLFARDLEDPSRDILLDLLIQVLATKSTQNYWVET